MPLFLLACKTQANGEWMPNVTVAGARWVSNAERRVPGTQGPPGFPLLAEPQPDCWGLSPTHKCLHHALRSHQLRPGPYNRA